MSALGGTRPRVVVVLENESMEIGTTFWRRVQWLTASAVMAWLGACLFGIWFARDLNAWRWLGFPLGFWISAQGLLFFFLCLIVLYVVWIEQLESRALAAASVADSRAAQ